MIIANIDGFDSCNFGNMVSFSKRFNSLEEAKNWVNDNSSPFDYEYFISSYHEEKNEEEKNEK